MRLMPQPPALEDSKKTKAPLAGLLKSSTSLVRLPALMDPSSRSTGQLDCTHTYRCTNAFRSSVFMNYINK